MALNMDILILQKITKVRAHDSFWKYVAKYSYFLDLDRSHMAAAGLGLEPRYSPPEGDVLPLDDPAIKTIYDFKINISNDGDVPLQQMRVCGS